MRGTLINMDHARFADCLRCPLDQRPVVGEGPVPARLMLIGQNPGAEEEKTGRPFVGRSGKYLNKVLAANGLKREDIFITSVVKCPTENNRRPTQKEIDSCLPLLVAQITRIKPLVIILMGQVAWQTPRLRGIEYRETYHPSAAMRFTKIRVKFEDDFKKLAGRVKQLK